ncbi:MAG: methyltransferase family protein [Chitinophagaceae bacterium]
MPLQEEFEKQGNFLFRYRGILPIIIVLPAIAVLWFQLPDLKDHQQSSSHIIAYVVAFLGVFIRAYTVGFSSRNTSGRNTAEGQVADSVNTTGIYSIVRHPLYLGNFFMWLGVALLTHNGWFIMFFIALYMIYYERIMYAEEQFLRGKFGEAYTSWAAKTPAIIPDFSKFKSNTNTFSWKKVLKKEKTGILLLNLLFLLFSAIESYDSISIFSDVSPWSYLFIASIGYYVIVKILDKSTTLFHGV